MTIRYNGRYSSPRRSFDDPAGRCASTTMSSSHAIEYTAPGSAAMTGSAAHSVASADRPGVRTEHGAQRRYPHRPLCPVTATPPPPWPARAGSAASTGGCCGVGRVPGATKTWRGTRRARLAFLGRDRWARRWRPVGGQRVAVPACPLPLERNVVRVHRDKGKTGHIVDPLDQMARRLRDDDLHGREDCDVFQVTADG